MHFLFIYSNIQGRLEFLVKRTLRSHSQTFIRCHAVLVEKRHCKTCYELRCYLIVLIDDQLKLAYDDFRTIYLHRECKIYNKQRTWFPQLNIQKTIPTYQLEKIAGIQKKNK